LSLPKACSIDEHTFGTAVNLTCSPPTLLIANSRQFQLRHCNAIAYAHDVIGGATSWLPHFPVHLRLIVPITNFASASQGLATGMSMQFLAERRRSELGRSTGWSPKTTASHVTSVAVVVPDAWSEQASTPLDHEAIYRPSRIFGGGTLSVGPRSPTYTLFSHVCACPRGAFRQVHQRDLKHHNSQYFTSKLPALQSWPR
jgi:hypothetical protein